MANITIHDVTEEMIEALRAEAASSGDDKLVRACDEALNAVGVDERYEPIVRAINAARAQEGT